MELVEKEKTANKVKTFKIDYKGYKQTEPPTNVVTIMEKIVAITVNIAYHKAGLMATLACLGQQQITYTFFQQMVM